MNGPEEPFETFDPNLRRRMEAQARREFEAAESEAAALASRRRRLVDVAWEAAQSGSRVAIRVGRRELAGGPIYARNDLVSLRTRRAEVEVYLPNIDAMFFVPGSDGEGYAPGRGETFAARLAMLQLAGGAVEIVCRGGEVRFDGWIDQVARDHVVVETSHGAVFVALESIAYVVHSRRR